MGRTESLHQVPGDIVKAIDIVVGFKTTDIKEQNQRRALCKAAFNEGEKIIAEYGKEVDLTKDLRGKANPRIRATHKTEYVKMETDDKRIMAFSLQKDECDDESTLAVNAKVLIAPTKWDEIGSVCTLTRNSNASEDDKYKLIMGNTVISSPTSVSLLFHAIKTRLDYRKRVSPPASSGK